MDNRRYKSRYGGGGTSSRGSSKDSEERPQTSARQNPNDSLDSKRSGTSHGNKAKSAYAEELKQQMAEQSAKKKIGKYKDRVIDNLYMQEYNAYNPFGRGGAGAPYRD